jgi:hypothetical protein
MDFSPEQHQETDETDKVMGVTVDLTAFHTTSTICYTPTPEHCSKLIAGMQLDQHDDYLHRGVHPRQAESVLGKFNFTLSTYPKGVGRTATQSLINHTTGSVIQHPPSRETNSDGQDSMVAILVFFKDLFAKYHTLIFVFGRMHGKSSLYTPTLARESYVTYWACNLLTTSWVIGGFPSVFARLA